MGGGGGPVHLIFARAGNAAPAAWQLPFHGRLTHSRQIIFPFGTEQPVLTWVTISERRFPAPKRTYVVVVERIVAVGLLTQSDLDRLGNTLKKVFPLEEAPCFTDLIRAIEEADRDYRRRQDRRPH